MLNISRKFLILVLIVSCANINVHAADVYSLVRSGGNLTADQVKSLETSLEENSDDIDMRTKLVGYYYDIQFKDKTAGKNQRRHILWLIQHAPESELLRTPYGSIDSYRGGSDYAQGKEAWLKQVVANPENLKIIENAASYFQLEDREVALEILLKGRALDPDDPKWPASLGQIYSFDMMTNSLKRQTEAAVKALEQFEIAYNLSTEMGRDAIRGELAKTALAANSPEKAKKYAEEMLAKNTSGWNYGNNIHNGNQILGRLALAAGDIEKAKEYLLKAGATPGSPQLDSFGPDMTLAKELLDKGENEVVLEYFSLCAKFWEMGQDKLENWSSAVKNGKSPNFQSF